MPMMEAMIEKKPDYPSVRLPKGYAPPDDLKEGDEVPVLCKMKLKGDGTAELCSMDGAPYEAEEMKETVMEESPQSTESDDSKMDFKGRLQTLMKKARP